MSSCSLSLSLSAWLVGTATALMGLAQTDLRYSANPLLVNDAFTDREGVGEIVPCGPTNPCEPPCVYVTFTATDYKSSYAPGPCPTSPDNYLKRSYWCKKYSCVGANQYYWEFNLLSTSCIDHARNTDCPDDTCTP